MVTRPTNAFKRIKVTCTINKACTLHVSAILVANLRDVH